MGGRNYQNGEKSCDAVSKSIVNGFGIELCTRLSSLIANIKSGKCGFMTCSQVQSLATPFLQLWLGN